MKFNRSWAMPSANTFSIKPIRELILQHLHGISVDPFANRNRLANVTNDLDPEMKCDYTLDAKEFLKTFEDLSVDCVLFDPPYSTRQIAEHYKRLGQTVNMETTQSSFWGGLKKEISRVVKDGGKVLSFGWNSGGIGKGLGFDIKEILLVAHGGWHNDTICTVETKRDTQARLFN